MGLSNYVAYRCVAFNDMIGEGYALQSGQVDSTSMRQMTKTALLAKYVVDTTNAGLVAKQGRQLVVVSDINKPAAHIACGTSFSNYNVGFCHYTTTLVDVGTTSGSITISLTNYSRDPTAGYSNPQLTVTYGATSLLNVFVTANGTYTVNYIYDSSVGQTLIVKYGGVCIQ